MSEEISHIKLWAHQIDALERWKDRHFMALWWEMGVGKTLTAIYCYKEKTRQEGRHLRTLITSPKNVLHNWKREFEKYAKLGHRVLVLTGSTEQKLKALRNTQCNIIVINYESFRSNRFMAVLDRMHIEMIIADESQRFKNPNTITAKIMHSLGNKSRYRMTLSGTPILNTYEDLWSQIRFLNPALVGANFYAWRKKHFIDANAEKSWLKFPSYVPRPESLLEFKQLMAITGTTVKKADALDLPPLVKITQEVDLHDNIARQYRELEKTFIASIDNDVIVTDLVVTKMLRLNQLCAGILVGEKETKLVETEKNTALLEILSDICPNRRHKVIVWANFTGAIEQIKRICEAIDLRYCTIVGGQSSEERQQQIDSFNDDVDISVMIANQAAGGVGINLQSASYMIYYSRDYNLEKDLQSEARAYRGGSEQHQKVTRIDLVTKNTIEEDILSALRDKLELSELLRRIKDKHENR